MLEFPFFSLSFLLFSFLPPPCWKTVKTEVSAYGEILPAKKFGSHLLPLSFFFFFSPSWNPVFSDPLEQTRRIAEVALEQSNRPSFLTNLSSFSLFSLPFPLHASRWCASTSRVDERNRWSLLVFFFLFSPFFFRFFFFFSFPPSFILCTRAAVGAYMK